MYNKYDYELLGIIICFTFVNKSWSNLCRSGWRLIACGGESRQTSVLLLLVDALPLSLGELQKAVHGSQVDQQRLRGV